jgi:hypothetical protein
MARDVGRVSVGDMQSNICQGSLSRSGTQVFQASFQVLLLMNPLEVLMKKTTCANEISEKTTCKKIYIKKDHLSVAACLPN